MFSPPFRFHYSTKGGGIQDKLLDRSPSGGTESEVIPMSESENGYELTTDELAPPKPYTAERRAEIDELNAEIAELYRKIKG